MDILFIFIPVLNIGFSLSYLYDKIVLELERYDINWEKIVKKFYKIER